MGAKWFVSLSVALTLSACGSLRRGDLLFHVASTDNQITSVTPGMIDHVAIYMGSDSVIEAIPLKGVTTTPLHTLLQRESGAYVAGRVKGLHRKHSIDNARQFLGRPYDSLYLADNEAIYCTELIQLSYVDRHGTPVFLPVPMTFRDSSGTIPAFWTELYKRHQMSVPEGEPGSNPSEMARRQHVVLRKKLR